MIVNLNEPPSLLRNDMKGTNHWLKMKLVGTKSNRSAIGARVVVRYGKKVQAQEVLSQSSYYSVNDSRLHFGLGAEKIADISIRWPNGAHEELKAVAADQLIVVKEGSGIVPGQGWSKASAPGASTPIAMKLLRRCTLAIIRSGVFPLSCAFPNEISCPASANRLEPITSALRDATISIKAAQLSRIRSEGIPRRCAFVDPARRGARQPGRFQGRRSRLSASPEHLAELHHGSARRRAD